MIVFDPANVYDLGVKDIKGVPITNNCTVKCTREQAPDCKLFMMYENVDYTTLTITQGTEFLNQMFVKQRFYDKDGNAAHIQLYENSELLSAECDESIFGMVYYGRKGEVI